MPEALLKIQISSTAEIEKLLSEDSLKESLAKGMGQATRELHNGLEAALASLYNHTQKLGQVLKGSSSGVQSFSAGKYISTLEYTYKPLDLSKFPYSFYKGNIPPLPKRSEGWVHEVSIKNGRRKIVLGKDKRGGFIPRTKTGRAKTFGSFGEQMFERTSAKRYPLRLLIGPSLTQTALYVYNTEASIQKIKDRLPSIISSNLSI